MVAWGTILLHPQKMILLKLPPLILLQVFHPHICLTYLFLLLLLLLIVLLLSLLLVPDMLFLPTKVVTKMLLLLLHNPWRED
jgi:hypothetical protein